MRFNIETFWSYIMKTRQLVATLLASVIVIAAAPAFASGYGPAPFYRPSLDAPASQRGQNAEASSVARLNDADAQQAYGGVVTGGSQSGSRVTFAPMGDLYAHH
jgi:hypothetical protein